MSGVNDEYDWRYIPARLRTQPCDIEGTPVYLRMDA